MSSVNLPSSLTDPDSFRKFAEQVDRTKDHFVGDVRLIQGVLEVLSALKENHSPEVFERAVQEHLGDYKGEYWEKRISQFVGQVQQLVSLAAQGIFSRSPYPETPTHSRQVVKITP